MFGHFFRVYKNCSTWNKIFLLFLLKYASLIVITCFSKNVPRGTFNCARSYLELFKLRKLFHLPTRQAGMEYYIYYMLFLKSASREYPVGLWGHHRASN